MKPLDICRTCGVEDGKIGIFDDQGLEMQLAEKINAYLPISVSADDKLPLALCHLCIEHLEICHQLIASCIDTDERLRQLNSLEAEGETDLKSSQMTLDVFITPSLNSLSVEEENKSHTTVKDISDNGFVCDGCGLWFKEPQKFVTHQFLCSLIKYYVCVLCDYVAHDKIDLAKHIEIHEAFQHSMFAHSLHNVCFVCDRILSTKMALTLHMRTHSGEKPYTCKHCAKAFAQKNALQYHEKTHTVKPYYCKYCDKGFKGKLILQNHERTHTGERPCLCNICGASFKCLANLRQHMLVHDDEKHFKCLICDKTFRRPDKLRVHLRAHTGEKPYTCPTCSRGFSQKGDMMKHKLIHKVSNQIQPNIQETSLTTIQFIIQ